MVCVDVKHHVYLLTTKLSFAYACQDLVSREGEAAVTICSKLHQLRRYSFDVFFKLLDTQVQPVVLYVAEIWGIEHSACIIEKLHSFAMKKMLDVGISK